MIPLPIIAICLGAALWALEGIVLVPKLFLLPVAVVVLMTHSLTFILLNPFLAKEYKKLKEFSKDDYLTLILIALFGGAVATIAIVKALFLVNFQALSVVVLLQQLQPIFAITLAVVLLKEKANKKFYPLAALAIIASYFLAFGFNLPNFTTGKNTFYAALLSVLAAASWGASTVFSRKIAIKYNFKTITFYRTGITAIILLIYTAATSKLSTISQITTTQWSVLLIIALSSGVISLFLYYYGMKKVKAMVATICELFFPVTAVILDYFVNGTLFSPVQWIAAILLVGSITRIGILKAKEKI